MSRTVAAIAALTVDLSAGAAREIQVLPAGTFRARDGRPAEVPAWRLDAAIAARLIARLHARKTPLVVDYEHQTLHAEKNGQPAPASAWMSRFEWREGSGLWAIDVEWTDRAAALIASKEYRFFSPVFGYSRTTGEILDLYHAAITNNPALDGMEDLAGRAAARFLPQQQEIDMDALNALLAALGLKPVQTEEQAVAAATAYAATVKAKDEKIAALTDERTEQDKAIAALKAAGADEPDPEKYVPIGVVKDLQDKVAALSTTQQTREIDEIITAALSDGRLLPAMEDWARKLGAKDIAQLKSYVDAAQPIAALAGTQTGGKPKGASQDGALADEELAVCKALGIKAEDFKKNAAAA